MPKWIFEFSLELGAVGMAVMAGVAAYIKAYETANVEWPKSKHYMQFAMKQFYAAFASMLVWYLIKWAAAAGYAAPAPAIPLFIGIAAYNGVRVVDILTTTIIERGRKALGLEPTTQGDKP